MKLELSSTEKDLVFAEVERYLKNLGLTLAAKDSTRPWGGFFVIDEKQAPEFGKLFFPEINVNDLYLGNRLSPKILLVHPHTRLSWQYHHRRAEIWRVVSGVAGVVTSHDDEQGEVKTLKTGDTIRLAQGQRHRLVGLDGWGVIAEIWQHTDVANPSDESDIVRVQDDFGR